MTSDTKLEQAVGLMRGNAIRRLPVVEGDRPAGIVSIGDLAIEGDETSALADISAARLNQEECSPPPRQGPGAGCSS